MAITKFIKEVCLSQIIADIKALTKTNSTIFGVVDGQIDYRKLYDLYVHPRLKKVNLIELCIGTKVEVCGSDSKSTWVTSVTLTYYFLMKDSFCELLFVSGQEGIRDCYNDQFSLRPDLVPYLPSEYYDDEATLFLQDVFPEALIHPQSLDVFDISKRLGLSPKSNQFSRCSTILGQTYFTDVRGEDGKVIEEKTVYYSHSHKNAGQLSNTIIHECYHWYKHKHYFTLKKLFDLHGIEYPESESSLYWIERQAKDMAPRILMPKDSFLKKAHYFLKELSLEISKTQLDVLEGTIKLLAEFFQVSKQSAKLRMVEVGFPEAKGVLEYIGGEYVPGYSFDVDKVKNNQTFSISLSDLETLYQKDRVFRNVLDSGIYVYLESHLVLRLPEYVSKDYKGDLILTNSARNHLDECAILFEYYRKSGEQQIQSYNDFVLNREQYSNISFQMVFHNGFENASVARQDKMLLEQMDEEYRIYKQLTNDFASSMSTIKKWRKVSYKEIGEELHYDQKQISRIFKGDGSLHLFVLVCVYLQLPTSITNHLLEKSKWTLDLNNHTHRCYLD